MKTIAVILAAGESRKYEHPKALLEHEGGKSFLKSLASAFAKAGAEPIAVIGKDAARVREQHPDLLLVETQDWGQGVLASAKAGVRAALEEGAELVAIHPVDQPAIRASTLGALIKKAGEGDGIVPEFEGAPGFPLVLTVAGAEKLLGLSQGATLTAIGAQLGLQKVATKDPGPVVNINSPEVYERLFGEKPKLAPPPKKRGKKATG